LPWKERKIVVKKRKLRKKQRLHFEVVDRSRDVWVELLSLIITRIREQRANKV